ncbi:MAG: hypothetical protein R3277_04180 [Brumimicrobium sp.]|nr:hypothetical protein [Brumimicrobium sp.]
MGRKRRLIIVGLPLFAKRLSDSLGSRMKDWEVIHLDTYYKRKDKLKALFMVPRADVLYSLNGTLSQSRTIDLALKNKVKCIMHWVGTDVLKSTEAFNSGNYQKNYIHDIVHFCEVNWIREELKEINIEAKIMNFAAFEKKFEAVYPKDKKLRVLSYMSDERADFYGLPTLIRLAARNPAIEFTVVGAKGEKYSPLPPNLKALGWVNNMDKYFDDSHATMRIPEHDGLSTFVLESLARGKKVLYNHPYDHCIFTPSEKEMQEVLLSLNDEVSAGTFSPNLSGKTFIEENFNSDYVFSLLISEINALLD